MTPASREAPAVRAWRHWVVAGLVPCVAHHLNNRRAASLGVADLVARQPERASEHLAALHGDAALASEFLGTFSRLAKDPPAPGGRADLTSALEGVARLLAVLQHERSGTLDYRAPRGVVVARGSGQRWEQVLVGLAATVILPRPDGAPACACDLRAARTGAERVAVELTVGAPLRGDLHSSAGLPVEPRAVLAELERELAEDGAALSVADEPERCAFELELAAVEGLDAAESSSEEPRSAARILVHLGEPTLAELVKVVLSELGHEVELAASVSELLALGADPAWDLVLLDHGALRPGDRPAAAVLAPRTAVVSSTPSPEGDWRGVLRTPFRPGELKQFVEACLRDGG